MDMLETFTEDYTTYYGNDSLKYFADNESAALGGVSNTTKVTQSRDEDLAKIEIAVLALIFVFTVLGNFIVLMGIYFRRQKMSRMYYFILHLSIADLITAFFNVLTQLIWELTWHFQGGNFLCKFIKYAQILGPYSSSYVLVMTAVDRYQAICFPLSNCTWTARRSKLMLGFAWTLSVLLCVPQLFIFSYMEISPGISDCWATFVEGWGAKAYVTWYAITVFIIPLVILTFAYTCICRAIWINFSMKNSIRRHQFSRSSRTSRDSETENELSHTIVDSGNESHGGKHHQHGNGSQRLELLHRKTSVNNKSIPYYNNFKETGSGGGTSAGTGRDYAGNRGSRPESIMSWRKGEINSGKTVTLTTSFSMHPPHTTMTSDNSLESDHHPHHQQQDSSTGGGYPIHRPLNSRLTGAANKIAREQRYSKFRDPDDSDDDEIEPGSCSSPEMDSKVQIYSNSAKYSSSLHPSSSSARSEEVHRSGGGGSSSGGSSPSKFNRHGSNSKANNNKKTKSKARTYVWSSSKNTNSVREQSSGSSIVGERSSSVSELGSSSRGNMKQLLLTPSARNLNNSHSIVSRSSIGGGDDNSSTPHTHTTTTPLPGKQNNVNSFSSSRQLGPTPHPRPSSVKGISRAKIKTIKLTVTVICCYIFCSSPFIAAQLWATYDPDASKSPFWTGATFTILTLLASLNSCVNPWIFLFFNPNLLQDFLKGFGCSNLIPQKHRAGGGGGGGRSPSTATTIRRSASPGGAIISRANTTVRRDTVTRPETAATQLRSISISSKVNTNSTPVESVSTCLLSITAPTDVARSSGDTSQA